MVVPQELGRSTSGPGVGHTDVGSVTGSQTPSLYGTGRIQAVRGELKPDLWKIAYKGVQRLTSQSGTV